jgi:hypothetical protein
MATSSSASASSLEAQCQSLHVDLRQPPRQRGGRRYRLNAEVTPDPAPPTAPPANSAHPIRAITGDPRFNTEQIRYT